MLMSSPHLSPRSHATSPLPAPRTMDESILDFGEMDSLADFLQEDEILLNSDQWQMDINDVTVPSKQPPTSLLDAVHPLDQSSSSSHFTLSNSLNSHRSKVPVNEDSESSLPAASNVPFSTTMPSAMRPPKDAFDLSNTEDSAPGDDSVPLATSTAVYTASTVPVEKPNVNDVLLGRGGRNNQWTGNETLRELARTMASAYSAAPKRNKPAIAMLLVQKIRALTPSGRFLKQLQAVGSWMEVDEEVAREKASQCLRDIVAALTKHKLKNGDSSSDLLLLSSSASTSNLRHMTMSSMSSASMQRTSSAEQQRHRSVASFFGNRDSAEDRPTRNESMFPNTTAGRMGNAEWNMPNESVSSGSMGRFAASAARMPSSAAARAGLALLHQGSSSGLPNSSGNFSGLAASASNTSNAMLISSGNLPGLHHSAMGGGGMYNTTTTNDGPNDMAVSLEPKDFSVRFSAPDFDGELMRPDNANKRNSISASAPNLGDISQFLAKRRRQLANVQWPGENSGMQNATFSNNYATDNAMEPVQLDISSGRPMAGRAASMMTLGSTAATTRDVRTVDPLMQRLHTLRSNLNSQNSTSNEVDYRDPDTIRRLSIVREQDMSSLGNFNWNVEEELLQPPSGLERTPVNRSSFANMLQPKTNEPINCFTGLGALMGDTDDNALQRWIDRMAEEELS